MKYSPFVKTLAILLAVVCVTGLILSGIAVFCNLNYGYYTGSPDDRAASVITMHASEYAEQIAEEYAFSQSGMPREVWENHFGNGYLNWCIWPEVDYRITAQHEENAVVGDMTGRTDYYHTETIWLDRWGGYALKVGENYQLYPEYLSEGYQTTAPTVMPQETTAQVENTEPVQTLPPEVMIPDGFASGYATISTDNGDLYRVYRSEEPITFTVELFYTQEEYQEVLGGRVAVSPLAQAMYEMRYDALFLLGGCLLVLILLMTYLACAAGRKPDSDEIRPSGLNRLPLDLYTAADLFVGFWLVWLLFEPVMGGLFEQQTLWNEPFILLSLCALGLSLAIGLVCVLYWCALCAQLKSDGFWWRKSLIGRFGDTIWSFVKRMASKFLAWVAGLGGKMGGHIPSIGTMLRDLNDKLPLMWQWLAASMGIFAALALFGSLCGHSLGLFLYLVVVCFAVAAILYGARAFGELRRAAKRMSQGNLDVKINPDTMEGCFKDFAMDLNSLSDACITAAREQLKSERMKTELITNVSHDIKTPLTSIINYVDLLQKAQTEQEREEYLEVLERQSARLKKLIEDLMEMSKASSGNVAAEIAPTNVVESVNQALGEYSDRFDGLGLKVLFRKSGDSVMALCDGKLLWRVMSNVMSNVVKYAMPHTRVYLDLTVSEYKVQLALKNISREELNISAEELMERFVRGDESRNTEGNGLGLNIAKSLMEVQNGTLDLVVDGDLFKVVLTLPRADAGAGELYTLTQPEAD